MVLLMKSVGELGKKHNDRSINDTVSNLSGEEIDLIIGIIDEIPKQYLCIQNDCNRVDLAYSSRDIEQLRPSTHPVLLIKKFGVVVKVFYSIERAKKEMHARDIMKKQFGIIPAKMVCCEKYSLLITPYLDNMIMLSELSKIDFNCFIKDYDNVFCNVIGYISANKRNVKDISKVEYAGRSIECMKTWAYELSQLVDGYIIYSCVTNKKYDLSDVINKTILSLEREPRFSCAFSGDINCHNIMHTDKGCLYFDFEYWGNIEVEYLISVLIGSLFNHCEIVDNSHVEYDDYMGKVIYSLKNGFWEMKSINKFIGLEYDYEKVKGFIIAKMYYKFLDLVRNWNKSRLIVPLCIMLDYFEIVLNDGVGNNEYCFLGKKEIRSRANRVDNKKEH